MLVPPLCLEDTLGPGLASDKVDSMCALFGAFERGLVQGSTQDNDFKQSLQDSCNMPTMRLAKLHQTYHSSMLHHCTVQLF